MMPHFLGDPLTKLGKGLFFFWSFITQWCPYMVIFFRGALCYLTPLRFIDALLKTLSIDVYFIQFHPAAWIQHYMQFRVLQSKNAYKMDIGENFLTPIQFIDALLKTLPIDVYFIQFHSAAWLQHYMQFRVVKSKNAFKMDTGQYFLTPLRFIDAVLKTLSIDVYFIQFHSAAWM